MDFEFPQDKVSETVKKIEQLIDEGQTLLSLLGLTTSGDNIQSSPEQTMASGSGSGSGSKTTSEPPDVFGRDGDTEEIIGMLHDTAAHHSVTGIHGIPGSGKTTLAQNVCKREKNSEDRYFELIMWIHVTKKFSVHSIYHEMLEIASGKKMKKLSNLDMLQRTLNKRLKGKRLLLVLDDVWDPESVAERDNLEKLLSPFNKADKASRVLVTTRTADAAKLLGAQKPMLIPDMTDQEFFKMFMHYALDKTGVSDQDKGKFESIGEKISNLLQKSPLAARTVGSQLSLKTRRAEDIKFWINIFSEKSGLLKDTMGALWWSYHQLEEHVRQCFAYCSMFPRRYELERDKLVQMWMAQGFIDTCITSDIEFAASECFEVLKSASFIQINREFDGTEYYTVHDLLHDLAESVAGSDCFRIEKDTVDHQIPQEVRHLFIDSDNPKELMEQIVKLDTLRTLVMSRSGKQITEKDFESMLKKLKKLRYIDVFLEKQKVKQKELKKYVIPHCINELKHLRYLAIIGVGPIELPLAFTRLYHLQGFEVSFGTYVCCPHNKMADLENLRRIGGLRLSIPYIGRMNWLRTLGAFTVKKEKGYEITQLEKLDNIQDELKIYGLENIESIEEARGANLSNKLYVKYLVFNWKTMEAESSAWKKQKTTGGHHPKPEEILEALHPPVLLVKLWIENYDGSTFPSWLSGDYGKLKHLERLFFADCKNIQTLPGLPSSLKKLQIEDCPNISTLPELPASLEEFVILRCKKIESLPGLPSSLKILKITACREIKELPDELPPSLEELHCRKDLVNNRQDLGRIKTETY